MQESTQELSRREREKLSRRDEILQAAWKVFASKEYSSATIDDIAAAAELSKGTIYLYFQNKADLFLSTVEMGVKKFSSIIQEAISSNDDPVVGFKEITKCLLDYVEENVDFFKILSSEQAFFEIHDEMSHIGDFKKRIKDAFNHSVTMVADHIQRGIDVGVFRQIDSKDAAIFLLQIIHGLAIRRITNPTMVKLPEKVESITTILLDGLMRRDA